MSSPKKYTTPTMATRHVWVYEEEEKWQVFNERDQAVLDNAHEGEVLVLGGRCEANTRLYQLRAIYDDKLKKISRSSWFVQSTPFLQDDCKAISFWNSSSSSLVDPLVLPSGQRLYKSASGEIYLESTSLLSSAKLVVPVGSPQCPAIPPSFGDTPEIPCSHLLICVHGIGESLWSKKSFGQLPFETNVNSLRSLLVDPSDQQHRVEVLHIHWYHILADSAYAKRISDITLSTIPLFRKLANEAVSDVIFYLNAEHRDRVLAHVGARYIELVNLFKQRNTSFSGKVSLVGHSLGSVICFDLLTHRNDIQVDKLFLLGSPLGMFWTAQQTATSDHDFLPLKNCKGPIYNIFQPNDPVAYRLEPFLIPSMNLVEPMLVPYHKTGGMTTHVQIKHAASSIMGLFSNSNTTYFQRITEVYSGPAPPEPDSPLGIAIAEIKHVNANGRIDWVIQEGIIGGATEYADAIGAHTSYFDNPDVARFIANQIK